MFNAPRSWYVRAMRLSLKNWASAAVVALVVLGTAAAASAATIRVHYDTGFGKNIKIRGSKSPLSWNVGISATWTTGNVWVA